MQYITITIIFILFIFLFKKAAGTLKPNLINVISFLFYSMLIFQFIGATLIYFGFNNHYLIEKIQYNSTINKTYYSLLYTIIILPICIIIFNAIFFKISPKNVNDNYIKKIKESVIVGREDIDNKIYVIIKILSILCFASIIYVFYKIGYIPILKMLNSNFSFDTERILISRYFKGNIYIKNIVMLLITPMISRIAYIYMRVKKEYKWKKLFIFTLLISILALTYNFEKAPVLYYFLGFFLIEILLGNILQFKKIIPYVIGISFLTILLTTIIMGYSGNLLSLSSGPIARILITQVATLFLHFDAFGNSIDFLNGGSFPEIFSLIFDSQIYGYRSGQIIMDIYGGSAVINNTAGVMNTIFIGEAYANFGIMGVIIFPIFIALIFSVIFNIFMRSEKTPLNIALYIEIFIILIMTIQGGVVDFFYNIKIVIIILMIFTIKKLAITKQFIYRLNKRKE